MAITERELREEMGADDTPDFDGSDVCPECGGVIRLVTDNNYGADADGRRGMRVEWMECRNCEYTP